VAFAAVLFVYRGRLSVIFSSSEDSPDSLSVFLPSCQSTAAEPPNVSIGSDVQAVGGKTWRTVCIRKVIRRRHQRESPGDQAGWVLSCPEGIPRSSDRAIGAVGIRPARRERDWTIDADVSQLSGVRASIGICRRCYGIARQIHHGSYGVSRACHDGADSAVVPAVEVSKYSAGRAGRQHRRIGIGSLAVHHPVDQPVEERLVLHYWAADAACDLVGIEIVDGKPQAVGAP
jgi:hypothetical protein